MMRLSSSVRLTWSAGPGPSTGGAGGLPPGFLPVAAVLASRAAIFASYSACSRANRSFARASMIARARAISTRRCSRRASSSGIDIPSGTSAWSAASALAIKSATSACNWASIWPACSYDSAVAAGGGVDLGAVERDRAQLQHAHLTGELQDLDEQRLDRLEEAPPERRNGVVVRVLIGRNEAERDRIISRPLQLAAGEHAGGVAVDQDAQQNRRMIRRLTGTAIAAGHRPQIQAGDHLYHKAGQMLLRQPFVHRWRHQQTSVTVDRTEVLHAGKVRGAEKANQRPRILSQTDSSC